jgi:hypothetical protein
MTDARAIGNCAESIVMDQTVADRDGIRTFPGFP